MDEKYDTQQLEYVNTTETQPETSHDINKLETKQTLQHVDLENRFAFKGDNSDGKIDWNIRKLFASAFLAMLYTGTCLNQTSDDQNRMMAANLNTRVTNSPLLCRRKSPFYSRGPWNDRRNGLAAYRKYARHRCSCSLRRVHARPFWKAVYRTFRCFATLYWVPSRWYSSWIRSGSGRNGNRRGWSGSW